VVYETDAESGQRRWLLKAVRESAGELFSLFYGLNEKALRRRPEPNEWCMKEIAAHLRDAEVQWQKQLEAIAHTREPHLTCEPVDVFPSERDYRSQPLQRLLGEYEEARQETFWLLRMLDEDDWHRIGLHPYRGRITVYDIAREIHEHDLEHLNQARRQREYLGAPIKYV
jgi:DinB superfamily